MQLKVVQLKLYIYIFFCKQKFIIKNLLTRLSYREVKGLSLAQDHQFIQISAKFKFYPLDKATVEMVYNSRNSMKSLTNYEKPFGVELLIFFLIEGCLSLKVDNYECFVQDKSRFLLLIQKFFSLEVQIQQDSTPFHFVRRVNITFKFYLSQSQGL